MNIEALRRMPDEYRCHSCEYWDGYWHRCWLPKNNQFDVGSRGPMSWCAHWEPNWDMHQRPDRFDVHQW